jgi:serine/threonine protein kinase
MNLESTQALDICDDSSCSLTSTSSIENNSDFLLSYHDCSGHPLKPHVPTDESPQEFRWDAQYAVLRKIGQGAQGIVYLARREGADGYHVDVALKVFSRHPQWSMDEYLSEMRRVANQALTISKIQHDHLILIQNFVAQNETRVMVMEWIDGLDLAQLLDRRNWESQRQQLSPKDWDRFNDVVVTEGEDHCRLKPGIAVDILRGCLAGLASLHNEDIVHCDLKPANIMIKRSGMKKIVDVDSSCMLSEAGEQVRGTPYYMAPERLRPGPGRLNSDVASLGYILIEMLTGRRLFRHCHSRADLLEAKIELPKRLPDVLPPEVKRNAILTGLVSRMVAVEPSNRFPDADAVDLERTGAINFHRHLIKTDLATDYRRELAWWMDLISAAA